MYDYDFLENEPLVVLFCFVKRMVKSRQIETFPYFFDVLVVILYFF